MTSILTDKQFVYIVGAPRSGTTWLQSMLAAHPSVCTTVELRLFTVYTAPWIAAWNEEAAGIENGRWTQGLPFLWDRDEFYAFLREFLARVYERVLEGNAQATHIVDKHPRYSEFVDDIDDLMNEPRFIHIIRDGRDVASSMVAAHRNIGFGTGTVAESAREWKTSVQQARRAARFGDRYLEIRYESLSERPRESIRDVFDMCGLHSTDDEIAEIVESHRFETMKANRSTPVTGVQAAKGHYRKGRVGSWKEDFSPMDAYQFQRFAGDVLCELGYAEEGWWAHNWIQKLILPRLTRFTKTK